jgi:hypothetical protein
MEKLKDKHEILNNLHIVMYMPIEANENIEAFMIHRRNKFIENHYEKSCSLQLVYLIII